MTQKKREREENRKSDKDGDCAKSRIDFLQPRDGPRVFLVQ